MTATEMAKAKSDIESTADLLERAMKLSGLVTTLFQERGFPLVVVGGSAVEFYTEGGRKRSCRMAKEIVVGWDEWKASRAAKCRICAVWGSTHHLAARRITARRVIAFVRPSVASARRKNLRKKGLKTLDVRLRRGLRTLDVRLRRPFEAPYVLGLTSYVLTRVLRLKSYVLSLTP